MSRVSARESQAITDTYARAGLIASEFTLLGLGAATLLVSVLLVMLPDLNVLPILRPGLAAGSGLLACGAAVSVVGRWLDLGGSRRLSTLRGLWWPLLGFALTGAGLALLALHRSNLVRESAERTLWPATLLGLMAVLSVVAIALLATLGLRSLVAVTGGAPWPVVQLWQATTHCLVGGLGLIALIGHASDALPKTLQVYLATAVSVMAGHAAISATALLHQSRRTLAGVRAAGLHVPLLERGHKMASASLLLGLVLPGLVVMAHLLVNRELPLIPACGVVAISNHAMRYALVLLPLNTPFGRSPSGAP